MIWNPSDWREYPDIIALAEPTVTDALQVVWLPQLSETVNVTSELLQRIVPGAMFCEMWIPALLFVACTRMVASGIKPHPLVEHTTMFDGQ